MFDCAKNETVTVNACILRTKTTGGGGGVTVQLYLPLKGQQRAMIQNKS